MELVQLLNLCRVVCTKLLPICGVIVLIFLAVFVKHLINVMKQLNEMTTKLNHTVEVATRELETLEKPIQTISELSETVDQVHEASKHAVRSALVTVIDNFALIKDKVVNHLKKDKDDVDVEIIES